MSVRLRYKKGWGIAFLVVAVFTGVAASMRPTTIQLALTAMFTLLGIAYLRGTAAVVSGDALEVKNLFGRTAKRVPLESLSDLNLDGNTVMHGGKKILSGAMLNDADVAQLRAAIEAAGNPGT